MTLLPTLSKPASTDNVTLGAVKVRLSRNKSPSAEILINESEVINPPSSVKLPAQANEAPSTNELVKVPEQLVLMMLEVVVAWAEIGNITAKHNADKRRVIAIPYFISTKILKHDQPINVTN
jgi:hypothetical protein